MPDLSEAFSRAFLSAGRRGGEKPALSPVRYSNILACIYYTERGMMSRMAGGLYWKKLSREEREGRRARRYAVGSTRDSYKTKKARTKFGLEKIVLERMYVHERRSMQEIAAKLGCSLHKVSYWMEAYRVPKRSSSDAMYAKHNPNGDPFSFREPQNIDEAKLFGLGIGLYWGEGTKANKNSIRLGNTDPKLINEFMRFLIRFFGVRKVDMSFGLQIFGDIKPEAALDFWVRNLRIQRHQILKPTVTKSGSIGTYRKKSEYGVMTVMYHNKKLRDLLMSKLPL